MNRQKPPAVTATTRIGDDVDLERDDVRLRDGSRLTAEVADQLSERISRGGRPSLSGNRQTSPQIAFRVTPDMREKAEELAAREHKTLSELAREALEERVNAS